MESHVQKSKSKVQISRMASTSPKSPNLVKKRMIRRKQTARPVSRAVGLRKNASKSCSSAQQQQQQEISAVSKEAVAFALGWEPGTSAVLKWPCIASVPGEEGRTGSPKENGGRQISAVSENSVSRNSQKTKSQMKRKSKKGKKGSFSKGAEEGSEILETSSERVISMCKGETRTPPPSETSFDTLLSCISSALGKDDGLFDLEITPVRTGGGEASIESEFQMLADSSAPQLTEVVTAFDNLYDGNSQETSAIYLSPVASLTLRNSDDEGDYGIYPVDNIASALMGEIDLHVELENYLRAIDCFNTARNRTRNTLQSNFHEDHRPISRMNLRNRTDEFFELTEVKSNTSFASATSICAQQDGDTNKLRVFLDRKHEMASVSEEYFDPRNTKVFISQTQVTDKVGDIRKIKSDNDPKKVQQEYKLKSSIKRTFGKTSFQSFRPEEENPWVLPPFGSEHSTDSSVDSYEKILPFGMSSNKSCEEVKNQSGLLFTNSVYSLSAESFPTTVRKAASDSNRRQEKTLECSVVETGERIEPELLEETSSSSLLLEGIPQPEPNRRKWSPSLQELIEIYNNVLKQNKRLRSNSRTSVSRCVSSHLMSFLNEELKEKECKANLVMLSKTLHKRLKTPNLWKPGKQKKDNTLVEYVAMFQEILHSSLSISQIARLNNVISGLQDYSERNYDYMKNLRSMKKKEGKVTKAELGKGEARVETSPEPSDLQENPLPPSYCPKKLKQKYMVEKPVKSGKTPPVKPSAGRKPTPQSPKPVEEEENSEMTKVDLPAPTELESMLQSCFTPAGVDGKNSKEPNDKILLTVKLSGNQVLVSGMSYFKNEKALTPRKNRQNGTSELIIESVTKEQVKDVWCKKTRSSKLREVKNMSEEIVKPKSEMSVKPSVEAKKVKRKPKTAAEAIRGNEVKERYEMEGNRFLQSEPEEPKSMMQFEYDQMLLRAQHPIDAIIESSESKISEHVESSEEDQVKHEVEPPPEKKILLTDMQNSTTLKEALKEALGENVYSKDLTCDFGWSDDALDKSLTRTKSYMINREAMKRQSQAKKQVKHASTVRSLNDLKNGSKCRRKGRRQTSSYLCYPSILALQEKSLSAKQKTKKQFKQKCRSLYSSNSRISNCGLPGQQHGVSKRPSKELGPKQQKPPEREERGAEKSSVNTVMYVNSEVVPDSSMELLYCDNEDPSTSMSPKMSASMTKQNSKASTEKESFPVDVKKSAVSAITVDGVKESPIVIHSAKSDTDDMSFPSMMIHSDSFLKYYSSLPMAQENLHSLFKSSSDMKFYPGRVNSSERQPSPFVKFVLTPTQNAEAELPPNQVEVVDKKHAAEDAAVVDDGSKSEGAKAASEEVEEKISLVSIEKFIRKLSRSKKKEKTKPEPVKAKFQPKETTPSPAKSPPKKAPAPVPKPRPKLTDRKPYHECQKRKLIDKAKATAAAAAADNKGKVSNSKAKTPENKARTSDTKKKTGDSKAKPIVGKTKATDGKTKATDGKAKATDGKTKATEGKPTAGEDPEPKNSELNLISLRDFILTFSQIMESYQNCSRAVEDFDTGKQGEEEEGAFAESELKTSGPKVEGLEKSTNTVPEMKCSLTRISDAAADIPAKSLQAVKSANTQTDESLNTFEEKLESEPEGQLVEGPRVCWDLRCPSRRSAETSPLRRQKTLKIKIHCDDWEREGRSRQEKAVAEGGKQKGLGGEIGLVDSLVRREPEVKVLERRNSTYFDATESLGGWRSERGRRKDQQQEFLAYWATVDLKNLSNGLVEEKICESSSSTEILFETPTDEPAEVLFNKILSSLQDGDVCRSLALLDDILRVAEYSPEWSANFERLRKVLLLVRSESKNVITSLEKNAWVKVLSLLEDVTRMCGGEGGNLEGSTTSFVDKIQKLNDRRLLDLKKFCSSASVTNDRNGSSLLNSVFCRIRNSLKYLKSRISVRRCRFAHSIQSSEEEEENPLQRLRKEIQQERAYMEFLKKSDCGFVREEVEDVKTKVVEKMKSFEKMFSGGEGYSAKERANGMVSSWGRAVSLLNFGRSYSRCE